MGQTARWRAARRPLRTVTYILLLLAAAAGAWATRVHSPDAARSLDLAALPAPRAASAPGLDEDGRGGSFSVLTYNVAGSPRWLTGQPTAHTAPAIAERLNAYDLVLLQEDFTQHEALRTGARHPYSSAVGALRRSLFGDGLTRFSQLSFVPVTRTPWDECHGLLDEGHDCLAQKGFSRAETRLSDDAALDVYNFALDVGSEPPDRDARARQLSKLARALEMHSAGHAVIVAGDSASSPGSPEDARLLARFLERTELRDACEAMLCDAPSRARIFYRGSPELALEPVRWRRASEFGALSGHEAVVTDFRWHLEEPGQRAAAVLVSP